MLATIQETVHLFKITSSYLLTNCYIDNYLRRNQCKIPI